MLDRLRWRLTMGYAGIFVLILVLLGAAAVLGFSRELTDQQDTLLTQEAEDVTRNLQDGEHREVLAEGSAEYSWVALDTGAASPTGTPPPRPWEPWASPPKGSPKMRSRRAKRSPPPSAVRRATRGSSACP